MEIKKEITSHQIEYTRMIVPSSMRSQYWKYFGFPSDNSNTILTKQKIICSICNVAIAYNKNTSNLRTHLVAKHPDIIIKLTNEKRKCTGRDIRSGDDSFCAKLPRTLSIPIKSNSMSPPVVVLPNSNPSNEPLKINGVNSTTINSLVCANEIGPFQGYEYASSLNQHNDYTFEPMEVSSLKTKTSGITNIDKQIVDMLIQDLLPPALIDGEGFSKFVWNIAGITAVGRRYNVEQILNKHYNDKFEKIVSDLKIITNNSPYSFSIEISSNIENKKLFIVYVNYLQIEPVPELHNVFYKLIEFKKYTDLNDVLNEFNLKNCSAVVVNSDNADLESFLNANDIPMIICFETIINRCMKSIFDLQSVDLMYTKVLDMYIDSLSSMLKSAPEICDENPWSKYDFLKFFHENMPLKYCDNLYVLQTKELVDYLAPLRMTMETMSDEPLAFASLIKPLATRLLQENFSDIYSDSDLLMEIKIVVEELLMRVSENTFLNEATLFDPRFINFIDSNTIKDTKKNIEVRYKNHFGATTEEKVLKKENVNKPSRKSSLKIFFNRNNINDPTCKDNKNVFENEVIKYLNEVNTDLEQCPVDWWIENGLSYKKLKKLSVWYLCIPCCINRLHKESVYKQIETKNRRYMLRKNVMNPIWFLHFNKKIIDGTYKEPQQI